MILLSPTTSSSQKMVIVLKRGTKKLPQQLNLKKEILTKKKQFDRVPSWLQMSKRDLEKIMITIVLDASKSFVSSRFTECCF